MPLGYLFLSEPPVEKTPIADFRVGRRQPVESSADLLDTIYLSQRRQAWFEEYLAVSGEAEVLDFVGSARQLSVASAAADISERLDYSVDKRRELPTAADARRHLSTAFEAIGGLVVLNSMVANNTKRMLNLEEFRGFALQSHTAPLVFVNANDTDNGQVFSLLHEFAHIWRGDEGVSQGGMPWLDERQDVEKWCDAVAAEVAVPGEDLRRSYDPTASLTAQLTRLSNRYLCSTLVILIKLRDVQLIPQAGFNTIYQGEKSRLLQAIARKPKTSGGSNFYNSQPLRVGRTFSRAVIRDTQRGSTSMTEALRLLSLKNVAMFDKYADSLTGR